MVWASAIVVYYCGCTWSKAWKVLKRLGLGSVTIRLALPKIRLLIYEKRRTPGSVVAPGTGGLNQRGHDHVPFIISSFEDRKHHVIFRKNDLNF